MSWVSSESVAILSFLLPGFVTVAVINTFTSHPRPNQFDLVVRALIFTMLTQAIVEGYLWIHSLFGAKPQPSGSTDILVSVLVAVVLGLVVVFVSNTDMVHSLFRWIHLTKETAHPSEWYSAFHHNPDCYVVLHLEGERRLYGWPEEWPSQPNQGHFRIAEAEWIVDDTRIPAEGVMSIVVAAEDVEMVEFLKYIILEDHTE